MNSRTVPRPTLPRPAVDGAVAAVRRLAFWGAVVLPLVYLPILSTPVTDRQFVVLAGLVAVNVLCLFVGHDYSP